MTHSVAVKQNTSVPPPQSPSLQQTLLEQKKIVYPSTKIPLLFDCFQGILRNYPAFMRVSLNVTNKISIQRILESQKNEKVRPFYRAS